MCLQRLERRCCDQSSGFASARRWFFEREASEVEMRVSESDVNDAATWIVNRLNAMLEDLPENHPHYEKTSRNDRARRSYRRRVGEGRRTPATDVEVVLPVGKPPALATMLDRFLVVR